MLSNWFIVTSYVYKPRPLCKMEQEVEQLKSLVEDLFSRIESLETRVNVLEEEGSAPKGPEPILTCVQCLADYKQSENAEGHCKYHTGTLRYGNWKATYTCCGASAADREKARKLPGCTKGRHCNKHHTHYPYSNYYFHMVDLSEGAKEMWLEMDLFDPITDNCIWGEIGLSTEDKLFIAVGSTRIQPVACAELSMREVKQGKAAVMCEHKDPSGTELKAELHVDGSVAKAVSVSLKAAGYKSPLVKRLQLVCSGNSFRPGSVDTLSDPTPPMVSVSGADRDVVREGPVLEPGEDYSVGRKTDYPTVTNDDMFALEMKQVGSISVNSGHKTASGKWNNVFTVSVKLALGIPGSVSITDVCGEYMNNDGVWVRCDKMWIRPSEAERFLETLDFIVDGSAPLTMVMQLTIGIDAPEPDSWTARERAHYSLPQPLHLKVTCVDYQDRTASLRLEQGNTPLNLPTYESRMKSWSRNRPLLFYQSADDVNAFKRSDVAIYYDDNGVMVYRPAPNDQGSNSFFVRENVLKKAAFQGQAEVELTSFKKENKGSMVQVYALVQQCAAYALKVVIMTPSSKADGLYLLPIEDFSVSSICTEPKQAVVGSQCTVTWKVPRASKCDRIELYLKHGNDSIARATNKQGDIESHCQIKVPMVPGEYEVRYYPSWLTGTYTGLRHNSYVAASPLTVMPA